MSEVETTYWQRLESAMTGSEYDTPTKLGKRVGCSSQTISHIKHGKSASLSGKYQTKVCEVFGIREAWLQTGAGEKYLPSQATKAAPPEEPLTAKLLDEWGKLDDFGKLKLLTEAIRISQQNPNYEAVQQPKKAG
jgi:transcriptional regulator with XRE-family HTH domain